MAGVYLALLLSVVASVAALNTTSLTEHMWLPGCLNQSLYTESILVYFNETDVLSADAFFSQSYVHQREKEYKSESVSRQGASPSNVRIDNSSTVSWLTHNQNADSLELWVDSPMKDHLVIRAGVETRR